MKDVKYTQDWPAYNKAKTREKATFIRLLNDLLDEAYPEKEKPKAPKRPVLTKKEILFACCVREYAGRSSRKAVSELSTMGVRTPHFNSINLHLRNPGLYKEFQKLIVISSLPLKQVESHIAVDSSGFGAPTHIPWKAKKWKVKTKLKRWVKAHIAVGERTQIICSAEATDSAIGDTTMFPSLVLTLSTFFEAKELSADKAYLSQKNLALCDDAGMVPYIPFKEGYHHGYDHPFPKNRIWRAMYWYFKNDRERFDGRYHRRSKAETAFSMMKRNQGERVRSKNPVAQKNELMCRFLVHNILVLVQEIHELELRVRFEEVRDEYMSCANNTKYPSGL